MTKRTCFLIGPTGRSGSETQERFDWLYQEIVKPTAERCGYDVTRPDELSGPGLISAQIIQRIFDADVVVADISGSNPNVMYELGVRHSTQKPVIQLANKLDRIPFDLAGLRVITYEATSALALADAQSKLTEMLETIDTDWDGRMSPVSGASALRMLRQPPEVPSDRSIVGAEFLTTIMQDFDKRLAGLEERLASKGRQIVGKEQNSRRIFVVHGHDTTLKNELARLLEKLDFKPIILHEQPNRGQTIIEKLGRELGDVGFAFVILTPDDVGAAATSATNLNFRARQNVVFEHGLFAGHLGTSRVCAILKGNVEIPSDLHGVVYRAVPENHSVDTIAVEIADELKAAGYIVDLNKLSKM
jgi:predicted nucleotide-binding protein